MKILQEVVSKDVIDLCNKEVDQYLKERVWSPSNVTWGSSLYEGIDGTCLAATPSSLMLIKIRAAIIKHLPPTK